MMAGMQPDTAEPVTQPDASAEESKEPGRFARWRARRAINREAAQAMRWERHVARGRAKRENHAAPALDAVDWGRWFPALMWFAAGVVAVTFVLSYHGLYENAARVVHLPEPLAILVPVGIDVFSLCCLTATFLLRDAPLRTRLYSWLMFGLTVAVSVAGNAVYAVSDVQRRAGTTDVAWGYLQLAAVIGAALWPAFSAGALHLLIVVRRHMERQRDKARQAAAEAEREAREQAAAIDRAAAAVALVKARAIVLAADGATVTEILTKLDLFEAQRRTVERWTKPVRDAMAAPRNGAAVKVASKRVSTRTDRETT